MPMTVGSLFAGIGGFDLAAERAGMTVKWQVEIDDFATRVLEKHWPNVKRYRDVRECGGYNLERVDIVCGGFPCQPFSSASRGRRLGTADSRYLWPEMCRVISELRPYWVVGENVAHIDGPALDAVVSGLEAIGYEVAPPLEVPACAFGHDHKRTRVWFLAHAYGSGEYGRPVNAETRMLQKCGDDAGSMGAADGLPGSMDRRRMKALGNAIVPSIAEWIFWRILEAEGSAA